jgi:hypothetical protein
MNFTVTVHFKHDNPCFSSVAYMVDKETYSTENELIRDIYACLEHSSIAYVHYKDDSLNNYNQKLYTKDEKYLKHSNWITSYLI